MTALWCIASFLAGLAVWPLYAAWKWNRMVRTPHPFPTDERP